MLIHRVCLSSLGKTRNHSELLLRILIAKLFPVSRFLLFRPDCHLSNSHDHEDERAQAEAHEEHTHPCNRFEHVVGTCDQVESESFWNTTLGASSTAQASQRQVCREVAQLSNDVKRQCGKNDQGICQCRGGSVGLVGPESNVCTSQKPVVRRILENVGERHGRATEAVDIECFQLALEKVCSDHEARKRLCCRRRTCIREKVWSKEVDQGVNKQRSSVLDDEYQLP